MQNTFSQSGNDSKWFSKKSFFRIGMWHSRPPRDPPPFMANTILNFHFDYLNPSLRHSFASCCLWGEAGNLGISGVWVFKGHQLAFEHSEDWQVGRGSLFSSRSQNWFNPLCRWTMPAMIGSSLTPLCLPPAMLLTNTGGCTKWSKRKSLKTNMRFSCSGKS